MLLIEFPRSCAVHVAKRHSTALIIGIDIVGLIALDPNRGSHKTRPVLERNDKKGRGRVDGGPREIALHVLNRGMNRFRRRNGRGRWLNHYQIVHDRRNLRI